MYIIFLLKKSQISYSVLSINIDSNKLGVFILNNNDKKNKLKFELTMFKQN